MSYRPQTLCASQNITTFKTLPKIAESACNPVKTPSTPAETPKSGCSCGGAAHHPATPTQVGVLSIDTQNRVNTTEFNTARLTFSDQLPGFDRLTLLSASIPINWDIINATNNQLTIEEQSPNNTFVVTISPGNYTASGLAAQLQSTLNASSPGLFTYTVGYNNITNKITIACTNTYRIRGDLNTSTSLAPLIGFPLSSTAYAITNTSTYKVDIGPPRQIYIRIKSVDGGVITSNDNNRGNTFVVPLSVGAYQVNLYEAMSAFEQTVDITPGAARALRNMEIGLYFENGTVIPIQSNWSCVLGMVSC